MEEVNKEAKIDNNDYAALVNALKEGNQLIKAERICPEEFEKDEDGNFHIDSIYSMANLRSSNY